MKVRVKKGKRRILALLVIFLIGVSLLSYVEIEKEIAPHPIFVLSNQPANGILAYPAAYEWPMFLHDSEHTGQLIMPAPHGASVLVSHVYNGAIKAGASTGQGVLYFSAGDTLYAVNSSTLQSLWSYTTSGTIYASPAVSNGLVFVASTDGTLTALDTSTAQKAWSYEIGSAVYSSPVVENGIVFVGSNGGKLYAFHASSGVLVSGYPFTSSGGIETSPAIQNSLVAFGSNDGTMFFVNETTGAELGSYTTGGPIQSSPALWNNFAYFGSNDSNIYGVNMHSHSLAWKLDTGGPVIGSPVVSQNGIVFVGSLDGNVYAVNGTSGALLWKTPTGPIVSSGALADAVGLNCCGGRQLLPSDQNYLSMLYVSSETGIVYGIRVDDGAVFWSYNLQNTTSASPIIAYTKLYIGSDSGIVWELGELTQSTSLGTLTTSGASQFSFVPGQPFVITALVAWGEYGINETALVNIYNSSGSQILQNGKMTFVTDETQYNFYYNYSGTQIAGNYGYVVVIEDAHPKFNSHHPRCCGYVNFTGQFTIA